MKSFSENNWIKIANKIMNWPPKELQNTIDQIQKIALVNMQKELEKQI